MLTANDVANYFLALCDEDAGDGISNLKLQKLVYYAQGVYLVINGGEPLFPDRIEAWMHGPVVPELYRAYKDFGSNSIPLPIDIDPTIYDEKTREILDEVYSVYGQFSASKLRNMTHEEPPWVDAKNNDRPITTESMLEYFRTIVTSD